MQLFKILEILIATALVYFLFSTLVSLISEWWLVKRETILTD
jgi:ABC-type amino acid transport system permease subunit